MTQAVMRRAPRNADGEIDEVELGRLLGVTADPTTEPLAFSQELLAKIKELASRIGGEQLPADDGSDDADSDQDDIDAMTPSIKNGTLVEFGARPARASAASKPARRSADTQDEFYAGTDDDVVGMTPPEFDHRTGRIVRR